MTDFRIVAFPMNASVCVCVLDQSLSSCPGFQLFPCKKIILQTGAGSHRAHDCFCFSVMGTIGDREWTFFEKCKNTKTTVNTAGPVGHVTGVSDVLCHFSRTFQGPRTLV